MENQEGYSICLDAETEKRPGTWGEPPYLPSQQKLVVDVHLNSLSLRSLLAMLPLPYYYPKEWYPQGFDVVLCEMDEGFFADPDDIVHPGLAPSPGKAAFIDIDWPFILQDTI